MGASDFTSDRVITCLQRDSLRVPMSSRDVTESQRNQNAKYQGIARHRVEGEPLNLFKMSVSSREWTVVGTSRVQRITEATQT